MKSFLRQHSLNTLTGCCLFLLIGSHLAGGPETPAKAFIDGNGPGWVALGEGDFVSANCPAGTWAWKDGGLHGTGQPTCVLRSKDRYTNFELVVQWRHLARGGNSGVFVWLVDDSLRDLEPGKLPHGIEVQVLDPGFTEDFEKRTGKKGDWFTAHGDVFAVGTARMTPFPPLSPDGSRSFPRKDLVLGESQWNHYYIRGINGEIRLWVNGEEVSGGSGCEPSSGYFALESEGSPVEFKEIRIRELP